MYVGEKMGPCIHPERACGLGRGFSQESRFVIRWLGQTVLKMKAEK